MTAQTLSGAKPIDHIPHWRHIHWETVGSTNVELLNAAQAGTKGNLWLTASEQTAGRGRRGRAWASPNDNLYASVLLTDPAPADQIGTLPLVASLAAREAVASLLPVGTAAKTKIKWPNDILIDGAKCAGLLLESQLDEASKTSVVLGFGINVRSHPTDTPYAATSLHAQGGQVEPATMFEALAKQFDAILHHWNKGRGFAEIRQEWLRHAAGIGQPIKVNLSDRSEQGIFVTIDEDGFLLLEQDNGKVLRVAAGDVFL